MKKKTVIGLTSVAFICSCLLLVASCAKKQVPAPEVVQPAPAEEVKMAEEMEPVEPDLDRKKEEAERQARLRELEKARRLADFESQHIFFDFDKSDLKRKAKAILKKKANWLRNNPSRSVSIQGHCDERGTNEYNLALGERRAHAAKKFLVAMGISAERIKTISYGEERPADPGRNESAWARNRRDEFKLIK
ncbi:MAG: peptidoglycan-associated lipoprotein Pal [Thermodesulfobacteriota bacterium]|nr:peptidoglycan-associated lipoprotein Pal [Thermodesulfobacteriota bacterium]